MAIANAYTTVNAVKTVHEIWSLLGKAGARQVSINFEEGSGLPEAVTFMVNTAGGVNLAFRLPCPVDGVEKVLATDKSIPKAKKTREHAVRVAWRVVRDWVRAQLALIEAGVATEEVFFPYLISDGGQTTVFEQFRSQYLLTDGGADDKV